MQELSLKNPCHRSPLFPVTELVTIVQDPARCRSAAANPFPSLRDGASPPLALSSPLLVIVADTY